MFRIQAARAGLVTDLIKAASVTRKFSGSSHALGSYNFEYSEQLNIPQQTDARLAGRRWLAGALNPSNKFPEYLRSPTANLPPVYTAESSQRDSSDSLNGWSRKTREILDSVLPQHGVALFRGLPITGADDFSTFLQGVDYKLVGYEGGLGVRQVVKDRVMTASDDVSEVTIQPHNELAYAAHYPTKGFKMSPPQPIGQKRIGRV
ncbi:uncharacterized protein [Ptychodera flava]|uniref:uncharacterized protein n=1 Tax=Ptychodera flava TaxID=63121 RepID=UPI00396A50A4